eukprot:Gb_13111 [translate_table: standard]
MLMGWKSFAQRSCASTTPKLLALNAGLIISTTFMVHLAHKKAACILVPLRKLFHPVGGREKAPAAFCRKEVPSNDKFEMWVVPRVLSVWLTKPDFRDPVNIGNDEMVSMNDMAAMVLGFEDKRLPIHHIPGPEGVRGYNSDNTLIKEKFCWAPSMKLKVSERSQKDYILLDQRTVRERKNSGIDVSTYGSSNVVGTKAPIQLGSFHAVDGTE